MYTEDASLKDHVRIARTLTRAFTSPPDMPADLRFAAAQSAIAPSQADRDRAESMSRLHDLASDCAPLDRKFRQRQSPAVARAAAPLRLGLISVLLFLLRWPDWAITSLFVRGFKVTGIVDPSNVYPSVAPTAWLDEAALLDPASADAWNSKIASDTKSSEFDQEEYDTAVKQRDARLLSHFMSKLQMDGFFGGPGTWRALRRWGIEQHGKIRGIDNARTSLHNAAAFIVETITTTLRTSPFRFYYGSQPQGSLCRGLASLLCARS